MYNYQYQQQPQFQNPYLNRLQQMQMPQMQQPEQLIRVTGEDGARAYPMPPNSTTALFDANDDILYIKSSDGAGFATIRKFRFLEIKDNPQTAPEYVTRQEFEELKEMLNNGKQPVSKSAPKSNVKHDE